MFVQMNNWSTSVDAHWMYPFSTICFEVIPVACRILNNWTPEICILGSHNVIPSAPGSYWIILNMFLNHGFITHLTFSLYYDSLADGNKHDFETVVIQTSQFRGHNVLITNFRAYFVMNFFLQKDMLPQKQDCDFLTGWRNVSIYWLMGFWSTQMYWLFETVNTGIIRTELHSHLIQNLAHKVSWLYYHD